MEAQLQPHRSKYWLNTTEKDPRVFEQQVGAVCNCYLAAPTLYSQHNTHTVSVDEMTGIQALERNAENIAPESLGRKGRSGTLKNVATRSGFLSDSTHRVRFVFLPKHSSWLNQIEVIFGIVSRRLLRGASFKSVQDLRERLIAFIKYFNATFAQPFRWTYTGKPLEKKQQKKEPRTWRSLWNATKMAA